MKFWSYIFRGLLLIATRRHRQFVANSETPAVQNAQWKECGTIIVNDPAQARVAVEACTYVAVNSETRPIPAVPNGPYEVRECETVNGTVAACLTMRELVLNSETAFVQNGPAQAAVQGIQHECTGSMSGGPPGCKDETRAEKEAAYTVEQQRRLGVDETGKPIQEEGEAEDHSEVEEGEDDRIQEAKDDSSVVSKYPGIPRAIKLDGHDRRGELVVPPCLNGVYYLTSEMILDEEPVWKRRDKCDGLTLIAHASWGNRPDWSSFGEDGRKHVVHMVFGVLEDAGGRQRQLWVYQFARIDHQVSRWKQ